MELEDKGAITLLQLNEQIKEAFLAAFPYPMWIRAEIAEIRENANGHCYLELIQKDTVSNYIVAKQRAAIFANIYRMVKPYFESVAGVSLSNGMQVLVMCAVEYHEQYGITLHIRDIDPTYTMGEAARRKQEIVNRLKAEGIYDMNKMLDMPMLPQRIAVISSATAAGYGDFEHQLTHNHFGYLFYITLFPAVMQGEQTELSVIAALDRINELSDQFDAVVIIRGGGATSDLSTFDNYEIASHCAQFPLPIVTGIGHLRDDTVLDEIVYKSAKTPTAVAEYLVALCRDTESHLNELEHRLTQCVKEVSQQEEMRLQRLISRAIQQVQYVVARQERQLDQCVQSLTFGVKSTMNSCMNHVDKCEIRIEAANPERLLGLGYTLTMKDGVAITSKSALQPGDIIETVFKDGKVRSAVTN